MAIRHTVVDGHQISVTRVRSRLLLYPTSTVTGPYIRRIRETVDSPIATAWLITAPDGSTSGAVGFLQSWKEIEGKNYAAPKTCVYTLYTTIF